MTRADLKKFLFEHAFQGVLTLLVTLAGTVGLYWINGIRSDVDALQCRIGKFGATTELNAIELKLIVTALDHVDRSSEPLVALNDTIENYRSVLDRCPEGKRLLADLEKYRSGFAHYIAREWDEAVDDLKLISARTALTEKAIANALLHVYAREKKFNGSRAHSVEQQLLARLTSAFELAGREHDFAVKERAIAHLECNRFVVLDDAEKSIFCFNDLIQRGYATYAVHYNLSVLYARQRQYEAAVNQMSLCIKQRGTQYWRRSDLERIPYFQALLSDEKHGSSFRILLNQFRN